MNKIERLFSNCINLIILQISKSLSTLRNLSLITSFRKMATYSQFLINRTQEYIRANDIECMNQITRKDKDLLLRIENFRQEKLTEDERHVETQEKILEEMKTNTMLRAFIRKDPTRQTIHEKTQIDWVRLHKYSDVQKMNADTGGICMTNHKLCKITGKRASTATKSFDTYVPSKNIYAVLKHTNTPGGAQDNQYKDVIHFITEIVGYLSETTEAPENFEFYLDGKYYTQEKISTLEKMIPENFKNKIIITNCEKILPSTHQQV